MFHRERVLLEEYVVPSDHLLLLKEQMGLGGSQFLSSRIRKGERLEVDR